ncbi:LysR family transcriptional regulator [Oxalobacteraceae bacterium A2-2]
MEALDYRALAILDAVATHGGVEQAARALGLGVQDVAHAIQSLEDACGRLLILPGPPAVATRLGQRLIAHQRGVRLMEASLDIDLGRPVSLPHIALAVEAASLATWFPLCLHPLLSPPRCQLALQAAPRAEALRLLRSGAVFGAVAAAADGTDDRCLDDDGVDDDGVDDDGVDEQGAGVADTCAGAVSIGAAPAWRGAIRVTPLGAMRHVCVATPAFAARWFGDGFSAEAVALAPSVVSDPAAMARLLREALGVQGGHPRHRMPLSAATSECIYGSLAYGLMPMAQVVGALSSGKLVELAPAHPVDVALEWHAWPLETPFTQALSEQVLATARRYLL